MNVPKAQYIISLLLTGTLCASVQASEIAIEKAPTIEMFTDSKLHVVPENDHTTVYVIDRIHRLQQELSNDLPADPKYAKAVALQRFQRLQQKNTQLNIELENAAKGLVQTVQYGIDRYPAIVFDSQAVVYGLTDINAATELYRQWQAEKMQP